MSAHKLVHVDELWVPVPPRVVVLIRRELGGVDRGMRLVVVAASGGLPEPAGTERRGVKAKRLMRRELLDGRPLVEIVW